MLSPHHSEYRLNTRFLGRLLLAVLVVGVGMYFLHAYQEKRLIDRYLTQADQAREAREPQREMNYLRTYLALKPDAAVRVRYGRLMARISQGGGAQKANEAREAFFALQRALSEDPNLPADVRMDCVKLALQLGRPD